MTIFLQSHRAAVVGGAGAIGSAICQEFAQAGASVSVLDINVEASEALVGSLSGQGHRALLVDVTDLSSIEHAVQETGPVDSVVYCPGVVFVADLTSTDWTDYRRLMAVNLDGAFYVGATFARRMMDYGRPGSLIFLSSGAGLRGEAGISAYCASKFGVIGLIQSLAAELTKSDIRVNAVCPGMVDSPMLRLTAHAQAARDDSSEGEILDRFRHTGAAVRLVAPSEVAAAVVWLASPFSAGITGEAIRIDAGAGVG